MELPWSSAEIQTLKELYPKTKTKQLAQILKRSPQAIRVRASQLRIRANNAYHHLENPEVNFYESLTQAERAYIAGILDGEGSVGYLNHYSKYTSTKRYGYRLATVSFSNTNKELMEWLHERLRGSLCQARHSNPKWSLCWALHLRGNIQAKNLLKVLLPYLIVKRDKVLEVLSHHTTFEYSPEQSDGN